jgi:hypothetical protein
MYFAEYKKQEKFYSKEYKIDLSRGTGQTRNCEAIDLVQ